jgi:hypothetical protein
MTYPIWKNNPRIDSFGFVLDTPLTVAKALVNWLTYKIGGRTPAPFHMVNIALHAGAVLTVFAILQNPARSASGVYCSSHFRGSSNPHGVRDLDRRRRVCPVQLLLPAITAVIY